MHLREMVQTARLSPQESRAFAAGLRSVASVEGPASMTEEAFIGRLCAEDPTVEASGFEALWPHSKLFLTACICLAVVDGNYSVSKARKISDFAHKLGFSAFQLGQLESELFSALRSEGESLPETGRLSFAKEKALRRPADRIPTSPYPAELSELWESDKELISHHGSTAPDEDVPNEIRSKKRKD